MSIDDYNATLISTDDNDNETENDEEESKPKITSVTKTFTGSVSWDSAWANRSGSGSGYKWKVIPNYGVTINSPRSLSTSITFRSEGNYTLEFYASDGAVCSKATKTIHIDFENDYNYIEPSKPTTPTDPENPDGPVENGEIDVEFKMPSVDGGAIVQDLECAIGIDVYAGSDWPNIIKSQASSIIQAIVPLSVNKPKIGLDEVYVLKERNDAYYPVWYDRVPLTDNMDSLISSFSRLNNFPVTDKQKLTYSYLHGRGHLLGQKYSGHGVHKLMIMFTNDKAINVGYGDDNYPTSEVAQKLRSMDVFLANMNLDYLNNLDELFDDNLSYKALGASMAISRADDIGTYLRKCFNKIYSNMEITLRIRPVSDVYSHSLYTNISPKEIHGVNQGDIIKAKFSFDMDKFKEVISNDPGLTVAKQDVLDIYIDVKLYDQALITTIPIKVKVR